MYINMFYQLPKETSGEYGIPLCTIKKEDLIQDENERCANE